MLFSWECLQKGAAQGGFMKNSVSMLQFASTMADALAIERPHQAAAPCPAVLDFMHQFQIPKAEKLLIYNPDAIGMWLYQKYFAFFQPMLADVQLTVPVCTVLPSVTPVCFGTMYTGVEPQIHGIMKYEKKLITVDSLFDRLAASSLKTALVAVEESSMSIIFQHRAIDYFILSSDEEANAKAEELIKEDKYDVLVVYNLEYDTVMHLSSPEAPDALAALNHHIAAFHRFCQDVRQIWKDKNYLTVWATDHGIHYNSDGHGTHGDDCEEDLNVLHFYGFHGKEREAAGCHE
jgi:predicted AlkP superfamily pyrophosphatase or phosphodiesterase